MRRPRPHPRPRRSLAPWSDSGRPTPLERREAPAPLAIVAAACAPTQRPTLPPPVQYELAALVRPAPGGGWVVASAVVRVRAGQTVAIIPQRGGGAELAVFNGGRPGAVVVVNYTGPPVDFALYGRGRVPSAVLHLGKGQSDWTIPQV